MHAWGLAGWLRFCLACLAWLAGWRAGWLAGLPGAACCAGFLPGIAWPSPTFLKTAFSRTCSKKVVGEPEFYKEKRYMRKKTSSLIPKKKNIHPKKKEQHQHIWKLSPHILFYGFISFFFFIVFCGNCVRVFFKNSTDHRRNRIHCTLRSSTLCFPQLLRGVVSVLLA